MDRLHLMTVFVAVVEAEGLNGGARKLQMSPPAVTRAIAALEKHLGVKLLERTTRYVRATEAGQRYYEEARRIVALANEADAAVQGINAEPQGVLAITASVLFGRLYVMPGIVDYLHLHPAVEVSALFVDRVVNMLEEGIDVAVRIGELPDSSYRALRVGSVRRVLCASPEYLSSHGIPQSPEDLLEHDIILARALSPVNELRFRRAGQSFVHKVRPKLTVSDNESAARAALAGLGITSLLNYQIAGPLHDGTLKTVLGEYDVPSMPVHILHREGQHATAKIRAFVDLLAQRLRGELVLN